MDEYPKQYLYRRVVRAKLYIDEHYAEGVDLANIADEACFSKFHFIRLFRTIYGKTPHQYLTERRIERAKELLSANDLRVTDVCFEVGFQSLGSFSALFRRYVGDGPQSFRERQKKSLRKVPGCFILMYGPKPVV